ncbi:MAG: pirin family protein [Ignavibacteriales bacterium]|nr:pirin family protein [Ignavibacteriales bacterium]
MSKNRSVIKIFSATPTIEGAGVHLKRGFGFNEVPLFDPFLLFDHFGSNIPQNYLKGFPWHPHRGIETITYILKGKVEHGDSMGNKGIIGSGDVQWMTAGSGIIHQEMPMGDKDGWNMGFQLWANLPKTDKMMKPRYRDVKNDQIPEVVLSNNVKIKIICGEVSGTKGPVQDIVIDPEYLDITVPAKTQFTYHTKPGHKVFAYLIEGEAYFSDEMKMVNHQNLVLFKDGEQINVSTKDSPARFLLISGKPIGEPIAWYGPIVMNTQAELKIAFEEYNNGTFIK